MMRYQLHKYSCVPTTMLNALYYLLKPTRSSNSSKVQNWFLADDLFMRQTFHRACDEIDGGTNYYSPFDWIKLNSESTSKDKSYIKLRPWEKMAFDRTSAFQSEKQLSAFLRNAHNKPNRRCAIIEISRGKKEKVSHWILLLGIENGVCYIFDPSPIKTRKIGIWINPEQKDVKFPDANLQVDVAKIFKKARFNDRNEYSAFLDGHFFLGMERIDESEPQKNTKHKKFIPIERAR